ncbi:MAG TPA: hypothetical protein PKN04_07115 [bacterium]|nr:hypothetical protein [bacterium]HNT65526.1 hypothetical protein [bacterium]HOX87416.1 hypothetical protein [bacterium]HPG46877.1 hypothetical protein [bacterium]HPM99143.1 hypothetical protein [bacterium]
MKIRLGCLVMAVLVVACANKSVTVSYPEKFQGLTQLTLASLTKNVSFTEEINKRVFLFFRSQARVAVTSNVTFDFYLDFEKDGYRVEFADQDKAMHFFAPPIRVKKPVINHSSVSYPASGLLINEDYEAVKILESLTDRFIEEGKKSLQDSVVIAKCHSQLHDFLLQFSQDLGYSLESIAIQFAEE